MKKTSENGITLIALVITIIVLLILAGVSISMLTGQNGILQRAANAKEKNSLASTKEQIQLEILGSYKTSDLEVDKDKLKSNLEGIGADVTGDEFPFIVKLNGYEYTINDDGAVEQLPEGTLGLAKNILDKDADPTSSESGPYINYFWKEGEEPILCRTLYDKDDQYGIQIISINPVRTVRLGANDESTNVTGSDSSYKVKNSYNRAIQTLNEWAESYIDKEDKKGIVKDARCVGSNPSNKNSESSYVFYSTVSSMSAFSYMSLRDVDSNSDTDVARLEEIGLKSFENTSIASTYWLASRCLGSYTRISNGKLQSGEFKMRIVTNTGTNDKANFIKITSSSSTTYSSPNHGLRPVFILNDNVVISGGKGTLVEPYILGNI